MSTIAESVTVNRVRLESIDIVRGVITVLSTGAYLSLRRKSKRESSRFLFTRGLWLIFLEGVVTRCFGWQLNFDYHVTMLIVLWALGWAMIVLSALVWLPASPVTTCGVVMIVGHN
jgi:uncharacterized membrane protein